MKYQIKLERFDWRCDRSWYIPKFRRQVHFLFQWLIIWRKYVQFEDGRIKECVFTSRKRALDYVQLDLHLEHNNIAKVEMAKYKKTLIKTIEV